MMLLMVGAGLGSYAILRSIERNGRAKLVHRRRLASLAAVPDGLRLLLLSAGATLAIVGGVLLLA
jgi:hypothetical protein